MIFPSKLASILPICFSCSLLLFIPVWCWAHFMLSDAIFYKMKATKKIQEIAKQKNNSFF